MAKAIKGVCVLNTHMVVLFFNYQRAVEQGDKGGGRQGAYAIATDTAFVFGLRFVSSGVACSAGSWTV